MPKAEFWLKALFQIVGANSRIDRLQRMSLRATSPNVHKAQRMSLRTRETRCSHPSSVYWVSLMLCIAQMHNEGTCSISFNWNMPDTTAPARWGRVASRASAPSQAGLYARAHETHYTREVRHEANCTLRAYGVVMAGGSVHQWQDSVVMCRLRAWPALTSSVRQMTRWSVTGITITCHVYNIFLSFTYIKLYIVLNSF